MHATVSLFATLCVLALARATPYYYPQQRQLFYPVVPQYQQYQPQPFYQRQVYYAAPAAANLVAPVSSALRYPLVAPAKQVVYYGAPAVAPYPSNLVYAGGADEAAGAEGGGFGSYFENFFGNFPAVFGFGQNQEAAESPSPAEGSSPAASPEKNEQAANSEQPAKEGEENKEKENEAEKPAQPAKAQKVKVAAKGGAQKYVVVGQPQFFGNYPVQGVNPAAVLPAANHGAVSSYLLLKNYPGYRLAPAPTPHFPVIPQAPQVPQAAAPQAPQAADSSDAELIPAGQPGAAALGYQKLLQDAQGGRESKEYDDAAVAVDAATPQDDKPSESSAEGGDDAGDKSEDEETGTSD